MVVGLLVGSISHGQDEAAPPAEPTTAPYVGPVVKEEVAVTQHESTIGGETFSYTARAGYMHLPDYDLKQKANMFYIAYTRDGVADVGTRPITFVFNGGPGSSSVWLHMGALGPRRVVMDDEGMPLPPPYRLVHNEHSWLDFTDLVFIDPVSTGYSRPIEGERASQFHGLDEDLRAVGEFIRLYTTRHGRWLSPKYLAGESYGTTRAAGLTGTLQETYGMYLNGVVLISAVLDFSTIRFDIGNDQPYWLYLSTYTATAWYHGKLAPELQADFAGTIAQAEQWASTEYLQALAKGDKLTEEERTHIAHQLARFTGLSEDFVRRSDLRIAIQNFTKELLRDEGRTVGRLDSRYKGIDRTGIGASPDYDPSMSAIRGPYSATVQDYIRRELRYENDHVYEILTGRVQPWSYAGNQNRYVNVAETLRSSMTRNRDLRVMLASGYYDLATPYFAAEYTMSHLGLDPELRGNIVTHRYDAGHMMYVRLVDLAKLKQDASAFYTAE